MFTDIPDVDTGSIARKRLTYCNQWFVCCVCNVQLALIERNDGTAGPDGPNVIAVLLGRGRPAAEGGTGIPEKWEDTVSHV